MRGWRPALRIARREALRHRARSLTVLLMIGLPVAGVTAADVVIRTADVSPAEALDRDLGRADALVTDTGYPRRVSLPGVRASLGPRARVLSDDSGIARVRTRLGAVVATSTEVDFRDPMTRGLFTVTKGRLPRATGEVAVGPGLAARGHGPGAHLPLLGVPTRTVVGVVTSARDGARDQVVGLPGATGQGDGLRRYLVAQPGGLSEGEVTALDRRGLAVQSRSHPNPFGDGGTSDEEAGFAALVVVMSLLEVALLAGPAFAVGARARRRTLALLAAAGAGPRDLRRSVLALALILGTAGALVGVAAGVGLGALAVPVAKRHVHQTFGPFDVAGLDLAAVALLGVLSAVLAAVVPAWLASRQDVAAVLAGRPPRPLPRRVFPLIGVGALGLGILGTIEGARTITNGATVVALATLATVAGMVLLVPVVLSTLARLIRRGPLPVRFAVRDIARNRSRTTPAVAAVAATVIGVTALGIGSASDARGRARAYTPLGPRGAAMIVSERPLTGRTALATRRAVPGATVRTVRGVSYRGQHVSFTGGRPNAYAGFGVFFVVARSADGLGLGIDRRAVPGANAVLARGGAVVLSVTTGGDRTTLKRRGHAPVTVPAVFAPPRFPFPAAEAVIAPSAARRLGVRVATHALIVDDVPITRARRRALQEVADVLSGASVHVERGFHYRAASVARLALGVAGALLMLGGTLTATFLALADARPDLATLRAVGAGPAARRSVAAAYAGVISAVGAALGIAIGFGPGLAAARSTTLTDPGAAIAVPWPLLGAVVLGLPVLAAVAMAATQGRAE